MSCNATTMRQQRLLDGVQQRIKVLESAVSRIVSTQKGLQKNASEVRAVIQRDISRQLELLRSREVWLLNRVDLMQHTKCDALCEQKEQLTCALGSLRNWLAVNAWCADEMLMAKIAGTLDVLAELETSPSQSASVGFTADVDHLRSAIRAFGTVDMTDMMTNPRSASLPPAVDEYDDMPHHILYKTVEDVRAKKCNDRSIQVAMPRLSPPLLSTNTGHHPQTSAYVMPTLSRCFQLPVHSRQPESVNQWLQDIQSDTDTEDEDDSGFELIGRHAGRAASTERGDVTKPAMAYFADIAKSSHSDWLWKAEARLSSNEECSYQVMHYFRTLSRDTKDWLQNRQPLKDEDAVNGGATKQKDNSCHLHQARNINWLSTTSSGSSQRLQGWLSGTACELPPSELRHNSVSTPITADLSTCPSPTGAWMSSVVKGDGFTADQHSMWLANNGSDSSPELLYQWALNIPVGDEDITMQDVVSSDGDGMTPTQDEVWDKESGERTVGRCDGKVDRDTRSSSTELFVCFAKNGFDVSDWLIHD